MQGSPIEEELVDVEHIEDEEVHEDSPADAEPAPLEEEKKDEDVEMDKEGDGDSTQNLFSSQ